MSTERTRERPIPVVDKKSATRSDPDAERRGLRRVLYFVFAAAILGIWFNPLIGGLCGVVALAGLASSCHPVR